DLTGRLQAGQAGHGDVEDGDVGLVELDLLDRLRPVARLGDDGQVRLVVEDQAQTPTDEGVVVAEQNRGRRAGLGVRRHRTPTSAAGYGTSRRTSVPPFSPLDMEKSAPMSSARSRMPRMPAPSTASARPT